MSRNIAAVALVLATCLTGACSDDGGSSRDTTTTADGAAASALPPVIVDSAADVEVSVGEFVVVSTPDATEVETSDSSVLEVSQAYSDGSAEYNAGAEAVAAGTATLSVMEGDTLLYEVQVTVTG